jgi:uncharacterized cupredoxin-like copper-binding protein
MQFMRSSRPSIRTTTLLVAALALGGCGSDDEGTAPDDMPMTQTMDGMDMDGMDMDEGEHEEFTFGEPADEADADRTVQVTALDSLKYEPASIAVAAGETITFEVTNDGAAVHEFVLGDAGMQAEHEVEMQEMMESGMQMHDEVNALRLEGGETKRITWHFTEAGQVEFACHQPGHYGGGMVGTLDVG